MYLRQLSLTNFRCYRQLELTLPRGAVVLVGRNAQGKTSLLEACYVLATSRSLQAGHDRELVNWKAEQDVMPYSRVGGLVEKAGMTTQLEVVNLRQEAKADEAERYLKRVRIDDIPRRAMDLLGHLNVVFFSPQDIEIVNGPPGERRRYLDSLLCQIDRNYCKTLSRYNRMLSQRNHLLRRLRDAGRHDSTSELDYWDEGLARDGGRIIARRWRCLLDLGGMVRETHADLSPEDPPLELLYMRSLQTQEESDAHPQLAAAGSARRPAASSTSTTAGVPDPSKLASQFLQALRAGHREQIARGVTTIGPHRDDLRFALGDIDMRTYGSRGQQRSVTLALKLAEARLMWADTGERPVILLDDVLSELDAERRERLVMGLDARQQILITTTDVEFLPASFLGQSLVLEIENGAIVAASRDGQAVRPPVGPASTADPAGSDDLLAGP